MQRPLLAIGVSMLLVGLTGATADGARVVAGLAPPGTAPVEPQGAAPSAAPPIRWVPAAATNYTSGREGERVRSIVIHETDGAYDGTISWFQTRSAGVSAHYVIRSSDGEITQMVGEADTAWHVRGFNRPSIGIEHEYDARLGIGHTDAQYRASAALVCDIARRHGIPIDRQHIIGHGEHPGADHPDPGPTWNWTYYMALVHEACGGSGLTASRAAPVGGLERGASGAAVLELQRALVRVGVLREVDLLGGAGIFGPRTETAVIAFQRAKGLPQTGYYGPLTAAALGRSTVAVAAAPQAVLSAGDSGEQVRQLQAALSQIGYMNVVTGTFGPITGDAVRSFQRDHGVPQTGTYGPLTRAALARVVY
ncbi:MAG: peptidoglycan-binding protein [Pseudonocardiales bacterium]